VIKKLLTSFVSLLLCLHTYAQHSDENAHIKQLKLYEDTLKILGKTFINDETDLVRKNANYKFIKTMVSALKTPNSFLYRFDSVKTISIINSPDNRFRIFTWPIMNEDGSYRFYGTIQMNTGGLLKMYPLEDYTPFFKNPEDSVVNNRKWLGAQYYKIVPVYGAKTYYILIGWKGNTVKSTKKVIDVLSFNDAGPAFGMPVFDGNGKTRNRVVFEYARQASMLLRYVPEQNLIVFDHLAPPDAKEKNKPETFGPDLTYDGYKLKNGRWVYVEQLDMRNVPDNASNAIDPQYIDPKKQALRDKKLVPTSH